MKYTTVGDTVNTAARLESYGKEIPVLDSESNCRILVGAETAAALGDEFQMQRVEDLVLKGKSEKVEVYEVVAFAESGV